MDEIPDIEEALTERWSELLKPGERVHVEGEPRDDGSFRGTFRLETPDGRGVQFELQADLATGREGDALRFFVWDALDALLGEYLEGDHDERLTGLEELREYDGRPVTVRIARRELRLEKEADALLRE